MLQRSLQIRDSRFRKRCPDQKYAHELLLLLCAQKKNMRRRKYLQLNGYRCKEHFSYVLPSTRPSGIFYTMSIPVYTIGMCRGVILIKWAQCWCNVQTEARSCKSHSTLRNIETHAVKLKCLYKNGVMRRCVCTFCAHPSYSFSECEEAVRCCVRP